MARSASSALATTWPTATPSVFPDCWEWRPDRSPPGRRSSPACAGYSASSAASAAAITAACESAPAGAVRLKMVRRGCRRSRKPRCRRTGFRSRARARRRSAARVGGSPTRDADPLDHRIGSTGGHLGHGQRSGLTDAGEVRDLHRDGRAAVRDRNVGRLGASRWRRRWTKPAPVLPAWRSHRKWVPEQCDGTGIR